MKKFLKFPHELVATLSIILLFSTKLYAYPYVDHYQPRFYPDKETYCPGDVATITIQDAGTVDPNTGGVSGSTPVYTENLLHQLSGGHVVACSITENVMPTVTGNGIISVEVQNRMGCTHVAGKIVIKLLASTTTTIHISWYSKWVYSADPINGTPETLWKENYYDGSKEIKVANMNAPILVPYNITINRGVYPEKIRASSIFVSEVDRKIKWYKSNCDGLPELIQQQYFYPPINYNDYYVDNTKLGRYNVWAQKVDGGCVSEMSQAAVVEVKPCNQTPPGCRQQDVNNIENNSCSPSAMSRNDHHFYYNEKEICSSNCNLETLWNQYKSDITNQVPIATDQALGLANNNGDALNSFLSFLMFPNENQGIAITDCAEVSLPRITSFLVRLAVKVKMGAIPDALEPLASVCVNNPYNNYDPVFLRVDEGNKCVTNYTLPGHAFYPGKVTRCLVQECDKVKVLTFGEGTTSVPYTCGPLLSVINEAWGSSMFKNVDNRVYRRFNSLPNPTDVASITGLANNRLLNKNWKVYKLQIKYPGDDSLYTFYSHSDTTNFFNLRKLNVYFTDSSKYMGIDVTGRFRTGKWAYDSINHKISSDSSICEFISQTDTSFTTRQSIPVMKDSILVQADCYFTFYQRDFENITYTFNGNGNWNLASNWLNGVMPPAEITYGTIVQINPSGTNAECVYNGDLIIDKGAQLIVSPGKKIKVTGKLLVR